MGDVLLVLMGAAGGGLVGHTLGIDYHRRRLRRLARSAPRDSIALATLERLMADDARSHLR